MITVILEDSLSSVKEVVGVQGNEKFLLQPDFAMLGRLDLYSYDVFSQEEMDDLISELIKIRSSVESSEIFEHISDVIRLAIKCKNISGSTLTFTPFGSDI